MKTNLIALDGIDQLSIPPRTRLALQQFISQLLTLHTEQPASVTAIGSAVTGEYVEHNSDLNLLIVYPRLEIADIERFAGRAREGLKRMRFSPRFLSEHNVNDFARYFPLDLLTMKAARVVMYGDDILGELEVRNADLHWQLAHEIKRLRMRIKQQLWRSQGDAKAMGRLVLARYSSLLYLTWGTLRLAGHSPPLTHGAIEEAAVRDLGVDAAFFRRMSELRHRRGKHRREDLTAAFAALLDTARIVDAALEEQEA